MIWENQEKLSEMNQKWLVTWVTSQQPIATQAKGVQSIGKTFIVRDNNKQGLLKVHHPQKHKKDSRKAFKS